MNKTEQILREHLQKGLLGNINLDAEIKAVASEIEAEYYEKEFVRWYSGMDADKIERAHQRWIRETQIQNKWKQYVIIGFG